MRSKKLQLGLRPHDVFSITDAPCFAMLQVTKVLNESHLVQKTSKG